MFRGICPQGFDRSNVLLQIGSEIQNNIKLCFAKHGVENVLSTKCFETHTLSRTKTRTNCSDNYGIVFFYMNVALVGLVVSGWACRVSLGLSCLVGLVVSCWACRRVLMSSHWIVVSLECRLVVLSSCVVARAKLIPARLLFGCRHKTKKLQILQSCFIDVVSHCARRENLVNMTRDLSVVRRAVVRAGFSGSKRARYNFQIVERTLRRHHANVLVLSGMDDNFVQHSLGCVSGKCIGN